MSYIVKAFSTREAARKLGLPSTTLHQYLSAGKLPAPKPIVINGVNVRSWTDEDVERARKALPKIANGRKTRYQKKHSAVSTQQKPKRGQRPRRRKEKPEPLWPKANG